MKIKIILILTALILVNTLSACSPLKKTETAEQPDNLNSITNETESDEEEKKTTTEKTPVSWEQVAYSYLPDFVIEENTAWEEKLVDYYYSDLDFQKGNLAVCIDFFDFSDETLTDFVEKSKLVGRTLTKEGAEHTLTLLYQEKFIDQFVGNAENIFDRETSILMNYSLILYASRADVQKFASCKQVKAVSSAKHLLFDEEKYVRPMGQHLVPLQTNVENYNNNVTAVPINYYYYKCSGYSQKMFDSNNYINNELVALQGARAIPLIKIDSAESLALMKGYGGTDEWEAFVNTYNASFFETKTLLFLPYAEGSGAYTHRIRQAYVSGNTFCMIVDRSFSHSVTWDEATWAIVLEVDRNLIENCTSFETWMYEHIREA